MNEIEYEHMQECAAMGETMAMALQAILDDCGVDNVAELYRIVYCDSVGD